MREAVPNGAASCSLGVVPPYRAGLRQTFSGQGETPYRRCWLLWLPQPASALHLCRGQADPVQFWGRRLQSG